MSWKKKIKKYNIKKKEELLEKYPRYKNKLQLGFFNGRETLLISQNPGNPLNGAPQKSVYGKKYEEMLRTTRMGKYIGRLIGLDWEGISVTNVVKIPTENNKTPDKKLVDIFGPITRGQIEILQPKFIILLGAFARDWAAGEYGFKNKGFRYEQKKNGMLFMVVHHHAAWGKVKDADIDFVKEKLDS